ncbi:hypothetical protein [Teredinibacter haidensis]|uniref:hypothetical protein n=1 Tax=Teredinibacter haidensis TaxID=2731755 RepID=UPI000948B9D1|nr:hypothetical protein [Teredinibacter haidensis]
MEDKEEENTSTGRQAALPVKRTRLLAAVEKLSALPRSIEIGYENTYLFAMDSAYLPVVTVR